ncbi:hypothetical protein GE061_009396, partial [Apolygus lucorum]
MLISLLKCPVLYLVPRPVIRAPRVVVGVKNTPPPCRVIHFPINPSISLSVPASPFTNPTRKMENLWVDGAIGAIKTIAFVCDIITYPLYLVLQRPWEKKEGSRRLKAEIVHQDKKSITYKSKEKFSDPHLKMLAANIDTMEKVLNYVKEIHRNKNALGTREILAEEDEVQSNGRVFKKYLLGEYKWRDYGQVHTEAIQFGRGLRTLGYQPKNNVVIFAETRAEWMIAAHACFKQNIT